MSSSEPIRKKPGRWPWDRPYRDNFQYILERDPVIYDMIYGTNFAQPVKQPGPGRKRSRRAERKKR